MQPLKARVRKGRLVLDEPKDRPEGEEAERVPLDEVLARRRLSREERAALHAELRASIAEARSGQVIDAELVCQFAGPWGHPLCRVMGPGKRIEQPEVRLPRNGLRVEGSKSRFRTTPGSEFLQGHGAVIVADVHALEDGVAAWRPEYRAAGRSHRESA